MKSINYGIQILLLVVVAGLASGCITPKEKKQLRKDMFNMQTRLLQLERQTTGDVKVAGSNNKQLASNTTGMEKLKLEIQRIKGEMESLRVGVVTGQMPGAEAMQEGSIAATVADLSTRVEALEASQEEILASIQKAGIKKKSKKRKGASGVKQLQVAFDKKRYKHVSEDAPKLLKKSGKSNKIIILYLYAESLFKLGKLRDAALKYNELLELKPSKKYLPRAKMRMGDCFRHLGDKVTAKLYYEELITEFPSSGEADKAKERLAKL